MAQLYLQTVTTRSHRVFRLSCVCPFPNTAKVRIALGKARSVPLMHMILVDDENIYEMYMCCELILPSLILYERDTKHDIGGLQWRLSGPWRPVLLPTCDAAGPHSYGGSSGDSCNDCL